LFVIVPYIVPCSRIAALAVRFLFVNFVLQAPRRGARCEFSGNAADMAKKAT